MKRIFLIALAAALFACGTGGPAQKAVDDFASALKNSSFLKAAAYLSPDLEILREKEGLSLLKSIIRDAGKAQTADNLIYKIGDLLVETEKIKGKWRISRLSHPELSVYLFLTALSRADYAAAAQELTIEIRDEFEIAAAILCSGPDNGLAWLVPGEFKILSSEITGNTAIVRYLADGEEDFFETKFREGEWDIAFPELSLLKPIK